MVLKKSTGSGCCCNGTASYAKWKLTPSAEAVEHADCIFAEG